MTMKSFLGTIIFCPQEKESIHDAALTLAKFKGWPETAELLAAIRDYARELGYY